MIRAVEKLFAFNKYKERRLKSISRQILDKVDRLQNTKCHLGQVLACSLEDNCGFGCLFHHLTVCFMLAFYTERTVVIATTERKGINKFHEVFQPVTNSCTFNHKNMSESNPGTADQFSLTRYLVETFQFQSKGWRSAPWSSSNSGHTAYEPTTSS